MIANENQQLYEQLQDPDPKTRIHAIRRLTAIVDLEAVPELAALYQSEDEPAAVRKAAEEGLGVFKAIQVALANEEQVELPDPDTVKDPPITVEALRRIVRVLAVVFVLLVGADVVLYLLGSGTLVMPPAGPDEMLSVMQTNLDQFRADVDNQQQAWRQYQAIQTLGCDRFPAPAATSINNAWITDMRIDEASQPELYAVGTAFARAITQFTLVSNEWTLGCSDQPTGGVETNLPRLNELSTAISEIDGTLGVARAAWEAANPDKGNTDPNAIITATPGGAVITVPPALQPTALLITADRYSAYIRGMRERIDAAAVGRGVLPLLSQYWQDVRDQGQTFGCNQSLTDETLQDYIGVSAADAELDPRLDSIQRAINAGMALARDSLTNFQQACQTGNFSTLVNAGQPQTEQALIALQQASEMLDILQAELR